MTRAPPEQQQLSLDLDTPNNADEDETWHAWFTALPPYPWRTPFIPPAKPASDNA